MVQVESMDAFLSFAADRVQAVASSTTSAEVHYEVYELNRLCLIALTAATDYRIDNAARYELGGSVDVEPWTASERLLMALNALFDATLKLIHGSNAGIYPSLDDDMDSLDLFDLDMPPPAELRHRMGWQLCRLSDVLLSAFRDRTSFLVSLRKCYFWPSARVAVDLGRSEQAFALSEKYREFHTLVELCLGDENRRSRIISYLDRFGSDFSDVLFDAYLKKGMLRELAEQPSKYHHLLERFYAQNSVPSLSWIHDVSVGRFEKASSSLWDVARDTRQRDSQMASIAQLFESFADQPANRNVMQVPEPVDSEKQLKAILAKQYTRFSKTHPMLMTLVAKAIRNLLRGVKLDLRDTIELLTSLDFTPQVAASELFFLALDIVGDQLFNESEAELSELELFYVNLIWRRAWIQGGWNEIMAKLKRSSTEQAQDALRLTPLFELVRNLVPLIGTKPYARHYQLSPQQLTVLPSMALLRLLHADLDEAQLTQMHQEYAAEQEALEEMFRVPTIVQMFDECVRMCQRDMDVE
nr:hypothetical protein HK105_007157 [Polyrhizophydium stewartii]